ncbi:hypothetical protein HDU98_006753 [Podochytrium sp. JEL0797]|nr:hypothetical protein HDU98_006753 [Podochytrium sp. JEL0797]
MLPLTQPPYLQFWVSPHGSNTAIGTSAQAAFHTISHALSQALQDTKINILPGIYPEIVSITNLGVNVVFEGQTVIPSVVEAAKSLIADSKSVIPGSPTWSPSGMVVITGFSIRGLGVTGSISLRNLTITNRTPGSTGLWIQAQPATVSASNCIISQTLGDGIRYVGGQSFSLSDSFVTFNNQPAAGAIDSPSQYLGGGLLCQAPNAFIQHNLFAFNGDNKFKHGIYNNAAATNMSILSNAFIQNSSAGVKVGGSGVAMHNFVSHNGKFGDGSVNKDCAGFVFGKLVSNTFEVSENVVAVSRDADASVSSNAVRQLSECNGMTSSIVMNRNCYDARLDFLVAENLKGFRTGPHLSFGAWKAEPFGPDGASCQFKELKASPVKVFPYFVE